MIRPYKMLEYVDELKNDYCVQMYGVVEKYNEDKPLDIDVPVILSGKNCMIKKIYVGYNNETEQENAILCSVEKPNGDIVSGYDLRDDFDIAVIHAVYTSVYDKH